MYGSIRIRRKFKLGDGRFLTISERCGSKKQKDADNINAMLDSLYSRGRLDVLTNISIGVVGLQQVREAFESGKLDSLPSAQTIQPVKNDLFAWLDAAELSENTKSGYRSGFNLLLTFGPKVPVISDLPEMLEQMREQYSREMKFRTFNLTRSAVQSYVRSTLKRNNPLYGAVRAVEPLNGKPRRQGNPLSVGQVLELITEMPTLYAKMFWSMCVTGMNVLEYANGWDVDGEMVKIHGTKREGRERVIPLFVPASDIIRPVGARQFIGSFKEGKYTKREVDGVKLIRQVAWYKPLRTALRKASKRTVQPHDARRTFSRWLMEAGVFATHAACYMGHGPKNITALYQTPRVAAGILEADRKKLLSYLKTETEKYHAERKQQFKIQRGAA